MPSSVPDLKLHLTLLNLDAKRAEFDANRAVVVLVERVRGQAAHYACFAHASVAKDNDFFGL